MCNFAFVAFYVLCYFYKILRLQRARIMKMLPIGISNYKELIEDNYYYIDKTLFIKEILKTGKKVVLLPRPRRFGKTLNLSMLHYFFEKTEEDTSRLFRNTAIWHDKESMKEQGQYPVIFLTLKGVKESAWQGAYAMLEEIIAHEFRRHSYLLNDALSPDEEARYQAILARKADQVSLKRSLFFLSELLYNHYKKRAILLIDEYDMPITSGYNNDYYQEVVEFMRSLLEAVCKDNNFLEQAVLTGILRIAKESVFSGLNNFKVCSLTDEPFQDKFGFTEKEVELLLKDQKLWDKRTQVKEWYNGYLFGNTTIYNPWSIIQCADERGLLKPYWVNTSDNLLTKKLLALADEEVKSDIELLLAGRTITTVIDDAVVFPGIECNEEAVWSLLVFTGYLAITKQELVMGKKVCTLTIPNQEIKILYADLIKEIFQATLTKIKTTRLLHALVEGDSQVFAEYLQEFIAKSMSSFDFADDEPEKSYHLFVLGLLIYLSDTHEIKSNRESGYGRYDLMIIPRAKNKLGIIIEFKKVHGKETLETACQRALDQIADKEYLHEMHDRGIKHIQKIGIAFQGKQLLVQAQDDKNSQK